MSEFQVLTTPIKSESDKKEYRLIELANGFKALLVRKVEESSESEPLVAVALKVNIGFYDEPKAIPGLAHFLEHNLDLGSEKYPDESCFNQFLCHNGGWGNATTESVCTSYYFEVSEKATSEAFDRLAQQFSSPLFKKNMLQREREAVDSEFQMAKCLDHIRIEEFYKVMMNEDSPASWFSYGNLQTLKDETTDDELHDAVRELFKKYVPNKMHFSMQSGKTLDEMQQLVVDNFSVLQRGEDDPRRIFTLEEIFKPDFYTKMYFVKPKESVQELYLTWCTESLDKYYLCRPLHYFAKIFNNEGEGGFSSYLKQERLAISVNLYTGCQLFIEDGMFSLLKLNVKLTEHGAENIDKVLDVIFSYLLMIKESSIDEHRRLYDEFKEKSEIDFKFERVMPAYFNVLSNTVGMHKFDDENIIKAHAVFQEFDEKVISDVIDVLNERKFNLMIVNDKHKSYDKKQKYFETEYEEMDFPEEYQKLWDERKAKPEFFLEKPNPFTCRNFDILVNEEEPLKYPVKVVDDETFEIWHKLDSKFKKPQAYISINIFSPFHVKSAYNYLSLMLFEKVFSFQLTKVIAPATTAGFFYCTGFQDDTFCLQFSGYNEKLLLLVESTVKILRQTLDHIDEKLFEMMKEDAMKNMKNILLFPHCLQGSLASKVLQTNVWAAWEHEREVDKLTIEDVQKLAKKFFFDSKIQILLQGNIGSSSADAVANILKEHFKIGSSANYKADARGYQIPLGTSIIRLKSLMPNAENSTLHNFYQIGPYSIRNDCLLQLLLSILNPRAFDFLRTKEQLGYDVGVYPEEYANVWGLSAFVSSQESKNNFERVLEKLEAFMTEVAPKVLEELTDEEFAVFVEARVKLLTTEDLDVDDEKERNWKEIAKQKYLFNRAQVAAAETLTLTRTDVQNFFKSFTEADNIRRLSIQVIGNKKSDETSQEVAVDSKLKIEFLDEKLNEDENLITNIEDFQRKMFLYPVA